MQEFLQINYRYHRKSLNNTCADCAHALLRLNAYARIHSEGVAWTKNVEHLTTSADAGCTVCELFVNATTESIANFKDLPSNTGTSSADVIRDWFPAELGFRIKASLPCDETGNHLFAVHIENRGMPPSSIEYYAEVTKDDPASLYAHVPVKAPVDRIRTWLRICETHHGQACRQHDAGFLPSRLLDLDPELGQKALKLVETKSFLKPSMYMAVSYCWGGAQPANLIRERLHSYQNGIDIASLPRSVQDAIYVARSLGSKYLWIDAYCILQDCATDKAIEIARMGQIYTNARLTIVISGAAKATDGIPAQKLHDYCVWSIPLTLPNTSVGTYRLRKATHLATQQPIDLRAWSFQERLLSPRIISFRCQGAALEWRCDFTQETDAGPCDSHFFVPKNWLFDDLLKNTRHNEPALNRLCFKWAQLVENYSARQLTYASDRLPAIGGIAQEMECIQLGNYAAGLWQGLIPTNLLWTVDDYRNVEEQDNSSNIPSWSWASAIGKVSMPYSLLPTNRLHARLLTMDIALADIDSPFGNLTRGCIRLEGFTREVVVKRSKLWDRTCGNSIGHANLDSPTSTTLPCALCFLIAGEGYDEDASTPTSTTSQNMTSFTQGLILVRSTLSPDLKRVGVFSSSGEMALPSVAPEAWTFRVISIV